MNNKNFKNPKEEPLSDVEYLKQLAVQCTIGTVLLLGFIAAKENFGRPSASSTYAPQRNARNQVGIVEHYILGPMRAAILPKFMRNNPNP